MSCLLCLYSRIAVAIEMPSVAAIFFQVVGVGPSASFRTCPGMMLTRGLPGLITDHLTVCNPDTLPAGNAREAGPLRSRGTVVIPWLRFQFALVLALCDRLWRLTDAHRASRINPGLVCC